MDNKKGILLVLIIGSVMLAYVSWSIGETMGINAASKKYEKKLSIEEERKEKKLQDKTIDEVLSKFYTFDKIGSNEASYQELTTEKFQSEQREKIAEAEKGKYPQNFGHSTFISSENYVRQVDKHTFEVISYVYHTVDLMSPDGTVVTKGIENNLSVKMIFLWNDHNKAFLLNKLTTLQAIE